MRQDSNAGRVTPDVNGHENALPTTACRTMGKRRRSPTLDLDLDGHTLSPTGLLHEAWLRLAARVALAPADTRELFAVASATMRRVLVDHARRRRRVRRGGLARVITLDDALDRGTAGAAAARED